MTTVDYALIMTTAMLASIIAAGLVLNATLEYEWAVDFQCNEQCGGYEKWHIRDNCMLECSCSDGSFRIGTETHMSCSKLREIEAKK